MLFFFSMKKQSRGPVTGLYGEKNRRKWSDFALCNLEREVDFALLFSDFKTLLSILITVIHSFDCLQLSNNASFRLSVAHGDTADCQVTLNRLPLLVNPYAIMDNYLNNQHMHL